MREIDEFIDFERLLDDYLDAIVDPIFDYEKVDSLCIQVEFIYDKLKLSGRLSVDEDLVLCRRLLALHLMHAKASAASENDHV